MCFLLPRRPLLHLPGHGKQPQHAQHCENEQAHYKYKKAQEACPRQYRGRRDYRHSYTITHTTWPKSMTWIGQFQMIEINEQSSAEGILGMK